MPIRDINLPDPRRGTNTPESVGVGLARIVKASIGAYATVKTEDRKLDDRMDAEFGEMEQIDYNDFVLEQSNKRLEDDYINGKDFEKQTIIEKQKEEMTSRFDGYKSTWSKKTRGGALSSYNPIIEKHYKDGTIKNTDALEKKQTSASVISPTASYTSFKEGNDKLNSLYGITGKNYDITLRVQEAGKQLANIIDTIDPNIWADMTDEDKALTYPLFYGEDKVQDATAQEFVKNAEARQVSKSKGIQAQYNTDVKNNIYTKAVTDSSSANLNSLKNKVISDKKLDGIPKKEIVSYLEARLNKGITKNKKFITAQKTGLNDALTSFEIQIDYSGENTPEQDTNVLSFVVTKAEKEYYALSNSIDTLYDGSEEGDAERNKKLHLKLDKAFKRSVYDTLLIGRHKIGEPIPEDYTPSSKRVLNDRYEKSFEVGLMSVDGRLRAKASDAVISLGKIPNSFVMKLADASANDDTEMVKDMLIGLKDVVANPEARVIATKDPEIGAILNAHEILRNPEAVLRIYKHIKSPDGKAEFETHRKEIFRELSKDNTIGKKSALTRSMMAKSLAYKTMFGTVSGKTVVKDAMNTLKDVQEIDDNIVITDVNSVYKKETLRTVTDIVSSHVLSESAKDDRLSIEVDGNGGLEIRSKDFLVFRSNDKEETDTYINSLLQLERENRSPDGTFTKIGKGLLKSGKQFRDKEGSQVALELMFKKKLYSDMFSGMADFIHSEYTGYEKQNKERYGR